MMSHPSTEHDETAWLRKARKAWLLREKAILAAHRARQAAGLAQPKPDPEAA